MLRFRDNMKSFLKLNITQWGKVLLELDKSHITPKSAEYYIIHLLSRLEGTWWFVQPRKFMSPEGDMNFLGWTNHHVSRLTGQLFIIPKAKHDVIRHRALCYETWQGDMKSGGRHEDLSSLHMTSLNQLYFFIYCISYKRYNKIHGSYC